MKKQPYRVRRQVWVLLLLGLAACSEAPAAADSHAGSSRDRSLSGTVLVDGSSTVFPVTEAVAEEFRSVAPNVRVLVGISGTGGGFEKFTRAETDVSDASRFIKHSEIEACAAGGIEFIELPVGYDGLSVVVHPDNDWVDTMTLAELRSMWSADTTTNTWKDIRSTWPDRPFRLYAPGQDSGTFDYFTEVVNGKSGNCRSDATFSEDDNVLVTGVAGDRDGIGFFGFAYYLANQERLHVVAVDGGQGPVVPSSATIEGGTYRPLSRPLFVYVSLEASERPAVSRFMDFYMESVPELLGSVGYVPLPRATMDAVRQRWQSRTAGSVRDRTGSLAERYR